MSLRIEKLYADLVTPDGTVCVVYVASLRYGRAHHPYAGAQLFRPDGTRECVRGTVSDGQWLRRPSAEDIEIRLDTGSGPLVLRYRVEVGDWQPPGEAPRAGLDWSVVMARGEGTLTWPRGSQDLAGCGYVDRVTADRAPRRFGIARLDWGRIHMSDSTTVYTRIDFRDRSWWGWTVRWPRGGQGPAAEPQLPRGDLRLHSVRCLHRGPAMQAAPDPTLRERLVSRLLVGPAIDDRRLSRATTPEATVPDSGWAVHETVRRRGRSQE